MKILPGNIQNVFHTIGNKITTGKSSSLMSRVLKSCHNIPDSEPHSQSECGSRMGKKFTRQKVIYYKSKIDWDVKVNKDKVNKEIGDFNLANKMQDGWFAKEAYQAMYGAIFGKCKDDFIEHAREKKIDLKGPEANKFYREIGLVAKEYGMDGKDNKIDNKNVVFTPTCVGANPFATAILSPVLKPVQNNSVRQQVTQYAEESLATQLRQIAVENKQKDPGEFSLELKTILMRTYS